MNIFSNCYKFIIFVDTFPKPHKKQKQKIISKIEYLSFNVSYLNHSVPVLPRKIIITELHNYNLPVKRDFINLCIIMEITAVWLLSSHT
jgi:hypothetical protein